ncbi:uncharacterized protein LOC131854373 [Achroia grisella]|uniref:uncharacterized protein LOC131854373 n=1 Tax=Achroia grisella TaxID=688607 RepID=UPI0027D31BE7|nr:uncharacterized protein LOC131854373 [Achroia grisella]
MKLSWLIGLFTFVPTYGLSPADKIRSKFYVTEWQQWEHVNNFGWRTSGVADIELAKAFVKFNGEIQKTPRPPAPALRSSWWQQPQLQIQRIEGMYRTFLQYMRRRAEPSAGSTSSAECLTLIRNVLTNRTRAPMSEVISKLQGSVLKTYQNILQAQHLYFNRSQLCEMQVSPHQLIYDVYNTVAVAEVKAYAMMQFSWMLKMIFETGDVTAVALKARGDFVRGTNMTANETRIALSHAKSDLYRCDPIRHTQGESYDEVTRLLQGYIENEVDMTKDNSCAEKCSYYSVAKNYGCFQDKFCARQSSCKGNIIDCHFVESDMTVCTSNYRSNRRYEWVKYVNGHTLGKETNCSVENGKSYRVQSWWRWLVWHCSYCMCLCDDPADSDRYFSLREATSDIQSNKVVTGVRIIKRGRMFHLQISQATLFKEGLVSQGNWVLNKIFSNTDRNVEEGIDYHTLNYRSRAIDLDDLVAPDGYVLLMYRFRLLGAHLNFNIRATKFDYKSGRLSIDSSTWLSNDNTEISANPRSRLELSRPSLPTLSTAAIPVNSRHDQFMEFTHSSFEADAAQTTVPFIDIQPIQVYRRGALLSGAGVMHRAEPGSGGFLALKLFTYNYTNHVHADSTVYHHYDKLTGTYTHIRF